MLRPEFFGAQAEGSRNGLGLFIKFEWIPQIDNQDVLTGIKPLFHLFGRDTCNGQVTEKPFPLKVFQQNVASDARGNDQAHPRTYPRRPGGEGFDFSAEPEAKTHKEKGPGKSS